MLQITPEVALVFQDLVISALGALIAFYLWNRYQNPVLAISGIQNHKLIYTDQEPSEVVRLNIENIGQTPARNCKASLWLKGIDHETNQIYAVNIPLSWPNKRASLITGRSDDFDKTKTIAPDGTETIELFSTSALGSFSPATWQTHGASIVRIDAEKLEIDAQGAIGDRVLLNRSAGASDDDVFTVNAGIGIDEFENSEWEEAEIRVVGENTNIVQRDLLLSIENEKVVAEIKPLRCIQRLKLRARRLI